VAVKLQYLLDLPVIAELTRPDGNRRVFTLFSQRQVTCAWAAPGMQALLQGVNGLHEGSRRARLLDFVNELLRSGPPVLPFDADAALWLVQENRRRERLHRQWSVTEAQTAAIAATRDLTLVTRGPSNYAGTPELRVEDWFRP